MRTFIVKSHTDESTKPEPTVSIRAVGSGKTNVTGALQEGMKVYEVPETEGCRGSVVFNIPHIHLTLDGARDEASPRFFLPEEDLEEVAP
jgi:hypothetical protein